MRHRNKTKRKRVVLGLIMGLTTGLFALSLSNALNAEGMASHKGWFRRAESVVCGDTLIDGHFKLTGNLTCTQDPAIKITGPAKLDLGGYTLSGGGNNDCILIEGDGARVWKGTVENCKDGVEIKLESDRNRIIRVEARNNARRGFRIRGDKNLLFSCSATMNGRQGIKIDGEPEDDEVPPTPEIPANGNKIFFSKVYANCRDGIEIQVGDYNRVYFNHVEDNGNPETCTKFGEAYKPWFYAGIDVLFGSENNEIKHNRAGCNLGCVGSNDFPCPARERDFWDENVDTSGNCDSNNDWEDNRIACKNAVPECSQNPAD